MGLLFSKSVSLVGLDISSTAVKLLELSQSTKKGKPHYKVESYLIEDLPSDAISDKHIENVEAVNAVIVKAVAKARLRSKHVAIAMPRSEVVTRVIQIVEGLPESEIEITVRDEAEQYIPYSMDDVSLDYAIIGPNENNTDEVDVQFAAAKTESVDNRLIAATIDALTVKVVDVEEFALENAFALLIEQSEDINDGDIVALIDIGATSITYSVLQDKKIIYTREQAFGGVQLTEHIVSQYGLEFDTAERAKRNPEELPDGYQDEVLMPFMVNIAEEVQRAEQYYYSSGSQGTINYTILTGGCAKIDKLDDVIQQQIGGSVRVARLFDEMSVGRRIKKNQLLQDAPALMIACGLALRSFD